jgi:hypothetical protein
LNFSNFYGNINFVVSNAPDVLETQSTSIINTKLANALQVTQ